MLQPLECFLYTHPQSSSLSHLVSCATSLVMSHVEIKYYSVAYFEQIATFEVLYRQTSARSRSHTHLLDEAVSAVSLRGAMSPSLL